MPKVLIIEDEAAIRAVLKDILKDQKELKLEVDEAKDGAEGLNLLLSNNYDVAFCDVKMPKMDGVELLKVAKTIRPDIEVILITGYGTVDTAVTAMKDGAYDYIEKPFKPREILKKVQKSLEKHCYG